MSENEEMQPNEAETEQGCEGEASAIEPAAEAPVDEKAAEAEPEGEPAANPQDSSITQAIAGGSLPTDDVSCYAQSVASTVRLVPSGKHSLHNLVDLEEAEDADAGAHSELTSDELDAALTPADGETEEPQTAAEEQAQETAAEDEQPENVEEAADAEESAEDEETAEDSSEAGEEADAEPAEEAAEAGEEATETDAEEAAAEATDAEEGDAETPEGEEADEAAETAEDAEAADADSETEGSAAEGAGLPEIPVIGPDGAAAEDAKPELTPEQLAARKRRRKRAGIAVGSVAGVLAAVYLGGTALFATHFLPNTVLNNQDVSMMSTGSLAKFIEDEGSTYATNATGMGLSLKVESEDVDFHYDGDAYVSDAMAQINYWAWPYEVTQSRSISVEKTTSLDEEKLGALVQAAVDKINEGAVMPSDAFVAYDSKAKEFTAQQEEPGTALDKDAVQQAIAEGMAQMKTTVFIGEDQLLQPKVSKDSKKVVKVLEKANAYAKLKIPLTVNGKEAFEVNAKHINKWVKIDDEFKVSLDQTALVNWAQGELSEKLDSAGSKRTYKRKDGKKVKVSGGTYGWIIDGEAVAEDLLEHMKDKDESKIKIKMKAEGTVWNPGGKDWDAYVDVDLGEQYARYYNSKGKLVWESDIVSGNTSQGRGTPTGVYEINGGKGTNVTLVGTDENGDGEPDYRSDVTYWMPFVGNAVGLHDATWRSSFGGSIYTYNGSHGCVNLPYSKAQALYSMVSVGTVVSVHY